LCLQPTLYVVTDPSPAALATITHNAFSAPASVIDEYARLAFFLRSFRQRPSMPRSGRRCGIGDRKRTMRIRLAATATATASSGARSVGRRGAIEGFPRDGSLKPTALSNWAARITRRLILRERTFTGVYTNTKSIGGSTYSECGKRERKRPEARCGSSRNRWTRAAGSTPH